MRAVQVVAPGKAVFVETAVPKIKPGHALIKTYRLSLCGSDIYMLHHAPKEQYPLPIGTTGHEMVGFVEAIGETNGAPLPFKIGDLTLTLAPTHEAMAEYFLAPFENILPLPSGTNPEYLLQAQQLGTVIYACKELPNIIGKDVVVIGQGSAGLWLNKMLSRLGARRIIGVDLQSHRLAVSSRYGATHTIHNKVQNALDALKEINGGKLADVVVEAAGEVESINLAIDLVAPSGFILQFGVPRFNKFPLNYGEMFTKTATIKAIVHASREPNHTSTRMALDMIASGEVEVAPIMTHRFSFDQLFDAYELQNTPDEGAIKIVIEMPEDDN